MPPEAAKEWFGVKPKMVIFKRHKKLIKPCLSLPRSGIVLSQFRPETEKKKIKS